MATKVADLYADLSIRGDDFDRKLAAGKAALEGVSKAADDSGEKVKQSAVKSANAYQRVATEAEKAGKAAKDASQKAMDAAERERIVRARLADAVAKHGDASKAAVTAQQRLESAQREATRTAERAERAQDQLVIVQRRQERQAQQAASAMRDAAGAMREMDNATPDGSKVQGFFDSLGQAATRGTEVAAMRGGMFGSEFLGGASAKLASLGGKTGPIGAALVGVAALGLSAGALLAQSIAAGAEKEAAQDLIQAKLGVNEETAARIGDAAGKAYTNAFGESTAANMDAARAAIQAGLLTGEEGAPEIQKMIERLDTVSQIMGTDVPTLARAAGQAIRTGMVADGAEAMDLFTAAAQRGLDTSGDLLDTVTEYGTQFRKVGLNGQDALGLVAQAMQAGARDTDVAADAIKEFSIRVVDGSELTSTAFSDLGLDAEDMAARFAQGGTTARDAFDQVLDTIRGIEDPVKRSQVAVSLFGTQAEDLGGALGAMDLSNARQELGDTAGAADEAAKVIGGNAKASWETLTRTVESSVGGVQQAMAEAFGPTAADMASKILENKQDIIIFFTDVVSAALTFGEGMAQAAVAGLHAWGLFAEGLGALMSNIGSIIATGGTLLGNFISLIPGMEEKGESIRNAAGAIADMGAAFETSGATARTMADTIANDVIPGMSNMRDSVQATGDAARATATGVDILTQSVIAVPDEKTIIIKDNSPATIAALEALGLKVETLPNGEVKVTADTDEGEAIMQEFVSRPRVVDIRVRANFDADARALYFGGNPNVQGPVPITQAAGSVREAQTTNRPILWGEAGPEAYIPLSPERRSRSTALLGEVANRFGMNLVKMAEGGVLGSIQAIQQDVAPSLKLTSGVRNEPGSHHHTGNAGDFSNGTSNTAEMLAFANHMADNYRDQLAELIYHDPRFSGRQIKNGQFVADSFYAGAGDHTNHVHVAAKQALQRRAQLATSLESNMPGPRALAGVGGLSGSSSKQDIANAIVGEGRKRGYTDAEIKAILSTALQESDMSPGAAGGGGAWHGIFQQDSSYPGRDDPNENIKAFYDRLDQKRKSAPGGDIWKDIFWLQQAPGMSSAESAYSGGRQAYLSEIQSRQAEADALLAAAGPGTAGLSTQSSTSMATSSGMPSSVSINGVVQVEVTNWPAAMQGQERTPLYSANFRYFAAGGMHGPEVVRPGDYRVLGDSEGPESYIPHAARYRKRALGLWAETGRALGVPGFAAGGFGGYTKDTSDYMAPKSLYDLAALGVGAGFTAYNAIQPYVAMAQSGRIDLGNLSPIIDTGANDLPGIAGAVSEAVSAYLPQITQLLQAILQRTPVEVNVDVDSGTGAAGIQLTKIGQ